MPTRAAINGVCACRMTSPTAFVRSSTRASPIPSVFASSAWSYGGYAALAGATFTPDLYACAASIGGISDLPDMVGFDSKNGGRESNSFAYVREHIGTPTDPQVIAKSPARFASAVRAPILLIHGVDDTVVPISQSQHMARALRAAGKVVRTHRVARRRPLDDDQQRLAHPHFDRARQLSLEAHRRRANCAESPARSLLADARAAPMYARLTFTGATGFDVGSEP